MFDFQVSEVPAVWRSDPGPLIIVSGIVLATIIITIILVRKEIKNEKKK